MDYVQFTQNNIYFTSVLIHNVLGWIHVLQFTYRKGWIETETDASICL